METAVFDRDTVRATFTDTRSATRHEIAQAIAQRIDAFNHRMPRYRKPWHCEDPRQSLFDAAALALTYFTLMGEA